VARKNFDKPWRVRHFESYARCPRQFFIRYIKEREEDHKSQPALMGISYHFCFEDWLRGAWDGLTGTQEQLAIAVARAEAEPDEMTGEVLPVKWKTSRNEAIMEGIDRLRNWMKEMVKHPLFQNTTTHLTEFKIRGKVNDKYDCATRGDALLEVNKGWKQFKPGDMIYLDFKTGERSQPTHQFFLDQNVQFDLTYICLKKGEMEWKNKQFRPSRSVLIGRRIFFCWFSLSDLTRYKVKSTRKLNSTEIPRDYAKWAEDQPGYDAIESVIVSSGEIKAKPGKPGEAGRYLKNGKYKEGKPGTPPINYKPGDLKGPATYFTTRAEENLPAIERNLGRICAGARMGIFPQSVYKMGPCDNCRVRTICSLEKDPEIKDDSVLKKAQKLTATMGENIF